MLIADEVNNMPLYQIMADAAAKVNPKSYLEIGCREGGSLLKMLESAPNLQAVVVVDTWGNGYGGTGRGNPKHIVKLLADKEYSGFFLALSGESQKLIPQVTGQFDMVLVDGDHSEAGASEDIKNCWPLLRTGGVLVFDDIVLHPYLDKVFDNFAASVPSMVFAKSTKNYGAAALVKL